jgi:hypothetical protein
VAGGGRLVLEAVSAWYPAEAPGPRCPGVQHYEGRLFLTAISRGRQVRMPGSLLECRRSLDWHPVVPRMWRGDSSFGYLCELGPVPVVRRA